MDIGSGIHYPAIDIPVDIALADTAAPVDTGIGSALESVPGCTWTVQSTSREHTSSSEIKIQNSITYLCGAVSYAWL